MKNAFIAAILCLFAGPLFAAEDSQQKATGFGENYQAALTDALLNAVRQTRGLEVGTEKSLRFDLSAIVTDDKAFMRGGSRIQTDVYNQSHGWIKSYQVTSVKKPASKDDVWQVEIDAIIPKYEQAVEDDQRKRMVIMPFRINPAEFRVDIEKESAADVVVQIADGLERTFTQTGKLAVLNRAFDKELTAERKLWSSEQVPPQEASRLGETLGADFVLLGNLYRFDISHKSKEMYGADFGGKFASIELYYSLVEAATQKVMWSQKRIFSLPLHEEKKLVREADPHTLSFVIDQVVAAISAELLDVMHPIKVMQVEDSAILLNQGMGRLTVGQHLAVHAKASQVADPDSGRTMNIRGREVAQIEITEVQPDYSRARLLSGEMSAIKINTVASALPPRDTKVVPPPRETPGSSEKPWSW